ncbi:unnamed protein product [Mycena citricolor]|uniref:Yeast cell wall synthesis Kre9/Knh1-like N-terminal domain-containing protein n=1 Tax=Mycena citricolor TaxID=2018698 RepID=A0AAD2GS08_9AGAR|nr:unnamed protein product [Mycena citricolor]CAK5262426.1 unnamed protein product [Mycena citricolor]
MGENWVHKDVPCHSRRLALRFFFSPTLVCLRCPDFTMFSTTKTSSALLAFVASAVAVSNLQAPTSVQPGQSVTVTWSSDSTDTQPAVLIMYSKKTYSGAFALADDIDLQKNSLTVDLPQVYTGDNFTFEIVNKNDQSKVLAQSNAFSVGGTPVASTMSAASTASPTATASASASAKHASSGTHSASATKTMSGSMTHSGSMTASAHPTSSSAAFPSGTFSLVSSLASTISMESSAAVAAFSSATSMIASSASAELSHIAASASASSKNSAPHGTKHVSRSAVALVAGGLLIGALMGLA